VARAARPTAALAGAGAVETRFVPPPTPTEPRRSRSSFALRALIVLASAWPLAAFADLWAYLDPQGHSHLADHRVDKRYQLFFKGPTTLDVPNGPAEEATPATAPLERGKREASATDPAIVAKYSPLIETGARANDLDPALVKAVVAAESGFDPRAVSDKGAIGLMQVLPDTAARYGITTDRRRTVEDKLRDPAINVRIGARYLHDLLARFAGDLSLALAAYNAGEGAVTSHANRVPPYDETRNYVTRVRRLYAIYRPAPAAPAGRVQIFMRAQSFADIASQ
jgi:soluble lytic murein transglycosylase-like protein